MSVKHDQHESCLALVQPYVFPQFVDRHAQRIGDHFHCIQSRVGLAMLKTAEVRLIEPAALPELHLRPAALFPQLPNTSAESLGECLLHTRDYLAYASIHINTNSYKLRRELFQRNTMDLQPSF